MWTEKYANFFPWQVFFSCILFHHQSGTKRKRNRGTYVRTLTLNLAGSLYRTTDLSMAVARNLCVGRQAKGGSGGMLPHNFLKLRSPEILFPEAITSSYLIQVMILVITRLHTAQVCILVSSILQCWFFGWGATFPLAPLLATAMLRICTCGLQQLEVMRPIFLQKQFKILVLAFRTDQYTLARRLQVQVRLRFHQEYQ